MSSNSNNVLASRDTNIPLVTSSAPGNATAVDGIRDVKSMEYHRQVLQSKMEEEKYEKTPKHLVSSPSPSLISSLANLSLSCSLHSSHSSSSSENKENFCVLSSSSPSSFPSLPAHQNQPQSLLHHQAQGEGDYDEEEEEKEEEERKEETSSPSPIVLPFRPGSASSTNAAQYRRDQRLKKNKDGKTTPTSSRADSLVPCHRLSRQKQYISPSDNIMSPCTAKLNAFRSKQAGKAKPKTLFMHASSKRLDGGAEDRIFRSTTNTTITRSNNSQPPTASTTTKDSSI